MKICIVAETNLLAQTTVYFLQRWLEQVDRNSIEIAILHCTDDINTTSKEEISLTETPIIFISEVGFREIFYPLQKFAILSYVTSKDAIDEHIRGSDIVVVSGHYQNQSKKVILGSASEYVLQQALCPIMVIPNPNRLIMHKAQAVIKELDFQI